MAIAAPVGVLIGTGPAVEPAPGDDERTPREAPTAPLRPSQATPHHPIRIATPAHRASASSEARLAKRIRELVRASGLAAPRGKGAVAVSVRACDDGAGPGRELVAIDADRPLKPASNMKVVSTGAALHQLGPEFEFRTRIVRDEDTFIVVGDGDPAFGDPAFFEDLVYRDAEGRQRHLDEEALLGFWADAIAAAANDRPIRLLVDDSIFDRVGWNDGWNPNDRLRSFAAEVAGLNFHRNTLHFRPDATGGGRPDWSNMRPHAGWLLESSRNISTRGGEKAGSTAWISRSPESNDLTFRGVVKGRFLDSNDPLEVTVHDPPMLLADLLAERLAERGVEVTGIGRAKKAAATDDATVVGPVVRTPIGPIVERCNEASQNLYAESLLKRTVHARTGRAGSWDDADEVIRLVAEERLGDSAATLVESMHIDDGSGLSHDNRLTAGFLTAWLDSFDDEPALRHLFVESLSRGGDRDDGTLGKRFRDLPENCRVDGKSGYISGVSTLSGFVTGPDGRRWSFSVLCNGVAHDIRGAKTLQERIVREIALHGLSS